MLLSAVALARVSGVALERRKKAAEVPRRAVVAAQQARRQLERQRMLAVVANFEEAHAVHGGVEEHGAKVDFGRVVVQIGASLAANRNRK